MGAALSLFVLLSLSVFIIRVASIALRLTGLPDGTARFQALSAFSGTGFTTTEAETVVNYPVRRRIISLLMIIGNLGFVTVFATIVISLINTEGEMEAVMVQIAWLVAGLILLWFFILNSTADKLMCNVIGRVLKSTTRLGQRSYQRLLQIADGYSICEHPIASHWLEQPSALEKEDFERLNLNVLAVRFPNGSISMEFNSTHTLQSGAVLVVSGSDSGHDSL